MFFFEIILSILDLIAIYLNLFIYFFSPIIINFSFNEYLYILISLILDLVLFFIWFLIQWKIVELNSFIKRKWVIYNDIFILNFLFRFFPIISHLSIFLSWYNKNINKIQWFFSIFLWYIFIYIIGKIISQVLWKIFNPTYCTCWIDLSYYEGIAISLSWIFIFYIYIKLKNMFIKNKNI